MFFGSQLKSWRLAKGMTQEVLAQKAGVPRPNLADLEAGRRDCTVKTLTRLAYGLQISPGTLLDSFPQKAQILNRHEINAIARALINPRLKLSASLEPIRSAVKSVVLPILQAAGFSSKTTRLGIPRNSRRNPALEKIVPESLDQLILRVNKLAASFSSENL